MELAGCPRSAERRLLKSVCFVCEGETSSETEGRTSSALIKLSSPKCVMKVRRKAVVPSNLV